jgi:hypothetical protein
MPLRRLLKILLQTGSSERLVLQALDLTREQLADVVGRRRIFFGYLACPERSRK